MILLSFIAILTIILLIFGSRIYILSKSTKGEQIPSTRTQQALIVLDVQKDTIQIPQYKDQYEVIDHINSAIDYALKRDIFIVYAKQEISNPIDLILSGGLYKKNTSGTELADSLAIASDTIFPKSSNDSFSNREFEKFLAKNNIGELYLVGADASACVLKTALGARNRNYKVNILTDCIFSIDKTYLTKAMKEYKNNDIRLLPSSKLP